MRELARFVAEAKALAGRLDQVGSRLPDPAAAPFLHRQLERALIHLRRATAEKLPAIHTKMLADCERSDTGLMDRVRKTFSLRRTETREDIQRDIEESLEEGLQGNTWTIPIPDLLGFLATGRKSGVLWVHDADETFLLQLDEGTLVHATSDGNPDRMRLGEVLVHLGKIGEDELDAFIKGLGEEAGFLGAELLAAGRIQESDLTDALAYQIQEMFRRLLASRSSIFRFQEGIRLMSRNDVHLNIQSVLLEVMRQADELNKALSMFDEDGDGGLFDAEEEQDPIAALPSDEELAEAEASSSDDEDVDDPVQGEADGHDDVAEADEADEAEVA